MIFPLLMERIHFMHLAPIIPCTEDGSLHYRPRLRVADATNFGRRVVS